MFQNETDRWVVLNALKLAEREHAAHAETMRTLADQGGNGMITADAARDLAGTQDRQAAECARVHELIEAAD